MMPVVPPRSLIEDTGQVGSLSGHLHENWFCLRAGNQAPPAHRIQNEVGAFEQDAAISIGALKFSL